MPISNGITRAFSTLIMVSSLVFSATTLASTPEDKLKAAILFKLTKFVEWPRKQPSLTLCILGEGSINKELQKIHHKSSVGRRLSVTHKDQNARFDKLCDILYLHNIEQDVMVKVINKLKGQPVLTISDKRGFAEQGGLIGLQRKGKKSVL